MLPAAWIPTLQEAACTRQRYFSILSNYTKVIGACSFQIRCHLLKHVGFLEGVHTELACAILLTPLIVICLLSMQVEFSSSLIYLNQEIRPTHTASIILYVCEMGSQVDHCRRIARQRKCNEIRRSAFLYKLCANTTHSGAICNSGTIMGTEYYVGRVMDQCSHRAASKSNKIDIDILELLASISGWVAARWHVL